MAGYSKAKVQPDARMRAQRCLDRRLRGESWADIADAEGYASRGSAQTTVERLLDRTEFAEADRYRRIEGARLDALQARYWPDALDGDLKAAEYVLKLMAQRSKLLGLNVPERMVVAAGEQSTGEDWSETVAGLLREMAGAGRPAIEGETDTGTDMEGDSWVNV